jgi:hypothetical protein
MRQSATMDIQRPRHGSDFGSDFRRMRADDYERESRNPVARSLLRLAKDLDAR